MPRSFSDGPRSLPASPDLRHLKNQAKDLLKAGGARSLSDAQLKVARSYGFASWPQLKAHVDLLTHSGQLTEAINSDNIERVTQLMTDSPLLHTAPMGYGQSGPLTWVAECRSRAPSAARLAIARWMIQNGSDVHQGNDAPLMRAALHGVRIPMMDLLTQHGADVNAKWKGSFPILFAPCETIDPVSLAWLLEHGADPNAQGSQGESALDYLLESYVRSRDLTTCIDLLVRAGGKTRYETPGVLEILANDLDGLRARLDQVPGLALRRMPELGLGATGGRRMTLRGATLLHVAAEFGNVEAVRLLITAGADVNVRASVDEHGVGGQTPIYHAVTQVNDWGLAVAKELLERGADLSVRARIPGTYENADELLECTPLEYARRFPGAALPGSNARTLLLLAEHLG